MSWFHEVNETIAESITEGLRRMCPVSLLAASALRVSVLLT